MSVQLSSLRVLVKKYWQPGLFILSMAGLNKFRRTHLKTATPSLCFKVGFAGAITQLISDLSFHCVDTVNVKCKGNTDLIRWYSMVSSIWRKEGLKGFFVGINATFCAALLGGFTYFTIYRQFKHRLKNSEKQSKLKEFLCDSLAAATAESAALLIFFPLELVKVRLQTSNELYNYDSVLHGLKRVLHDGNDRVNALYGGSGPYFAMFILYTTIQFSCYEAFMRKYYSAKGTVSTGWNVLKASLLSGAIASLATNWLEVITINKQLNPAATISNIMKQEGASMVVKGVTPRLFFNMCQSVVIFFMLDKLCGLFNVNFEP